MFIRKERGVWWREAGRKNAEAKGFDLFFFRSRTQS
jgi:hypothetical protein